MGRRGETVLPAVRLQTDAVSEMNISSHSLDHEVFFPF